MTTVTWETTLCLVTLQSENLKHSGPPEFSESMMDTLFDRRRSDIIKNPFLALILRGDCKRPCFDQLHAHILER